MHKQFSSQTPYRWWRDFPKFPFYRVLFPIIDALNFVYKIWHASLTLRKPLLSITRNVGLPSFQPNIRNFIIWAVSEGKQMTGSRRETIRKHGGRVEDPPRMGGRTWRCIRVKSYFLRNSSFSGEKIPLRDYWLLRRNIPWGIRLPWGKSFLWGIIGSGA
jgi:hypothetical protein